MRKLMFVAVALTAVVAAGVAYSASSPSAKLKKQDRVWGGGYVALGTCSINVPDFCPPAARHYAVDAHAEGNGSGAAGDAAFNRATSNTVRCVRVDGDTAAVGAVIGEVVPDSPFNAGDYILQYFVDRGTSSPDAQRDLVSAVYVFPPTFAWPEGFPDVCPPANGTSDFPPVYLELTGGDMTVQDAPSD